MFNLETRLKQSEPLLQYAKELQAQVSTSELRIIILMLGSHLLEIVH